MKAIRNDIHHFIGWQMTWAVVLFAAYNAAPTAVPYLLSFIPRYPFGSWASIVVGATLFFSFVIIALAVLVGGLLVNPKIGAVVDGMIVGAIVGTALRVMDFGPNVAWMGIALIFFGYGAFAFFLPTLMFEESSRSRQRGYAQVLHRGVSGVLCLAFPLAFILIAMFENMGVGLLVLMIAFGILLGLGYAIHRRPERFTRMIPN